MAKQNRPQPNPDRSPTPIYIPTPDKGNKGRTIPPPPTKPVPSKK